MMRLSFGTNIRGRNGSWIRKTPMSLISRKRFVLKVKRHDTSVGVEDRVETAGYKVYVSGTTCMIENLRGNADIQIFNVQGQLVARDKTAQHNYSVSLKPGIHVVKISENGKDYVTKIILK